jgi:SAM-dependent methyltransferase
VGPQFEEGFEGGVREQSGRVRQEMDKEEIARRIASFPRWHYQFELAGQKTPIRGDFRSNGHQQRMRYFFGPLIELCGGSLEGKRVLDLGCNAGFWSLVAVESGCDFVLGIDGRQMHIDQADFVFEVKGVDKGRYEFVMGNVYDLDFRDFGNFDIVLCLGLLYHVSKPVSLLEKISQANDDILVIDTNLSLAPGSYLRLRREDLASPLHATERELVFSPTKRAVVDMASAFGYSSVVLKPEFSNYTGCRKYRQGRRRAFLCAKKTLLKELSAPTEPVSRAPTLRDLLWLVRDNAADVPNRLRKRSAAGAQVRYHERTPAHRLP